MELINKNSSFVSITTLEIAELTGKRHDHILRDCDEQLTKIVGLGGMPKFGDTYIHPQNLLLEAGVNLNKSLEVVLNRNNKNLKEQ